MSDSSFDRALQRQRAYSLLSKIFAEGVTPEVASLSQAIPVLEAVLPAQQDADQAGAEYQDLFGFNVLPYAGVFLDEQGKLGGGIHSGLNALYESFGFEPVYVPGVPDHISTQLEFLAFLSGLEIEAYGMANQNLVTSAMHHQQGEFLRNHLATWCFPFCSAVKGYGHPFYAEIAELTQALVHRHCEEVACNTSVADNLPPSPDILNDSKTGIKEIASFLCRPAFCGFYVSRKDIKQLAGRLNIPSGFGDRVQTLSNTLRSAIQFDTIPALLDRLSEHARFHRAEYEAQKRGGSERLNPMLNAWITKTETTLGLLAKIEAELLGSAQPD